MKQRLRWCFSLLVTVSCSALISFSGCAGGGGITHNPPKQMVAGQETPLELEVSVWGAGRGKMTSRYRNVTCHYRVAGTADFISLPMQAVKEFDSHPPDNRSGEFKCTLPPFPKTAKAVEYYFDFTFDGNSQSRPPVTIAVISEEENQKAVDDQPWIVVVSTSVGVRVSYPALGIAASWAPTNLMYGIGRFFQTKSQKNRFKTRRLSLWVCGARRLLGCAHN